MIRVFKNNKIFKEFEDKNMSNSIDVDSVCDELLSLKENLWKWDEVPHNKKKLVDSPKLYKLSSLWYELRSF